MMLRNYDVASLENIHPITFRKYTKHQINEKKNQHPTFKNQHATFLFL